MQCSATANCGHCLQCLCLFMCVLQVPCASSKPDKFVKIISVSFPAYFESRLINWSNISVCGIVWLALLAWLHYKQKKLELEYASKRLNWQYGEKEAQRAYILYSLMNLSWWTAVSLFLLSAFRTCTALLLKNFPTSGCPQNRWIFHESFYFRNYYYTNSITSHQYVCLRLFGLY